MMIRVKWGRLSTCGRLSTALSLLALALTLPLGAQQRRAPRPIGSIPESNPHSTAADVEAGRKLYLGRCGHCHGQSGEGGRGAVINSGHFRHGGSDRELFMIVRNGIPNTEMPGLFSLPEHEVWRIVAYVKQLGRQGAPETVTGEPAAGAKVYARLGCAQCHSIARHGGFTGPDLSDVGSRRPLRHLLQSIVEPNADLPLDYRTVIVMTADGTSVSGIHLNEDEYSVHLRDLSGNLRSFLKRELKEVRIPLQSLMPAYTSLSKADLDNLVAYLSSLGSTP